MIGAWMVARLESKICLAAKGALIPTGEGYEASPKHIQAQRTGKDDIEFVFQDGCVDCDLRNPIVAKQVDLMKQLGKELPLPPHNVKSTASSAHTT